MRAVSKASVAKLLTELGSADAARVKQAESSLDAILFPTFGPGPRTVSLEEAEVARQMHQQTLRESGVLQPLSEAASEGAERAREYAVTVLAHLGDERVVPILLKALVDPASPAVRRAAATSLGFIREATAIPMLVQALGDAAVETSTAAATALGYLRAQESVPPLMTFYERGDREAKLAALHALGMIGDARSVQLVRDALFHKDKKIRKAAKSALGDYDLKRRQGG